MNPSRPHYLLLTDTKNRRPEDSPSGGQWHFTLEPIRHGVRIEAGDVEPGVWGERLNLLAVIRGLEAIDTPSNVTLITSSRHVARGIRSGVAQWKANDWQWERFGEMTFVKYHDLWRRIDSAMQIHRVDCRVWAAGKRRALEPVLNNLHEPAASPRDSADGCRRELAIDPPAKRETSVGSDCETRARTTSLETISHNSVKHKCLSGSQSLDHDPFYEKAVVAHPAKRRIVLTTERMSDGMPVESDSGSAAERHQRLFRSTRKGWTRVTEIGDESPLAEVLPNTFGCSVN